MDIKYENGKIYIWYIFGGTSMLGTRNCIGNSCW